MFEWDTREEEGTRTEDTDTTRTLASRHNSDRDMFDGTGEDETLATDGAMGGGGER